MILCGAGGVFARNHRHGMRRGGRGTVQIFVREVIFAAEAQQRLEQVQGVSRVVAKEPLEGRLRFEIESLQGQPVRAELARAVVNAGWNLSELSSVGLSLEEIFLQLTASEKSVQPEKAPEPVVEGSQK